MNLILRKNPLKVHIVLLLGCLLMARPAIAQGNDITEGRKQYLQHCAACHGIKGDGHGPLEHELKEPPADFPAALPEIRKSASRGPDSAIHGRPGQRKGSWPS